jgi:D-aminopeptidase
LNAITDVAGVEAGHTTLISGDNVRTGVTAVWPRGKQNSDPVFGDFFAQNGNGDMTGTHWLDESGYLDGPVLINNTHSVGVVREAYLAWLVRNNCKPGTNVFPGGFFTYPIVAETYDGFLNDINGFHVKPEHADEALDGARGGRVAEGNVGGGTGMICYGFKGGIGTSSRRLPADAGGHMVGVLVQANFGGRRQLRIAGVPVGAEITENTPRAALGPAEPGRHTAGAADVGSIIIVVATDAPLLPHQMKRLARRASLGMARTGAVSGDSSGDIFIAFSTANERAAEEEISRKARTTTLTTVPNARVTPIFEAVVQATEEAIVNALIAAETMTGVDGHRVTAIPHERLRAVMKKYNR